MAACGGCSCGVCMWCLGGDVAGRLDWLISSGARRSRSSVRSRMSWNWTRRVRWTRNLRRSPERSAAAVAGD